MPLRRRRLLLATPLALAGCGGILAKQPYVARNDWPLAPPPPSGAVGGAPKGVILVQGIGAGPALSQRGLITQLADGSIHRGYYNRWATPPAQALTASLIAWLQASGDFAAVVGEGSSLTANFIVEGTLDTLLADPTAEVARCTLTLVVARPHGIGEMPVLQRRLHGVARLAGATAPDLVAGQRAAVGLVLGQAVGLVARRE